MGTQVRAQMINKCKMKMIQRDLYNMKEILLERGIGKIERENIVTT